MCRCENSSSARLATRYLNPKGGPVQEVQGQGRRVLFGALVPICCQVLRGSGNDDVEDDVQHEVDIEGDEIPGQRIW